MPRRSALVAVFVAISVYTCPAVALTFTVVLLTPWAAADLAHALRGDTDA